VLAKRGVKVETLPYDPDRPPALLRSADAAFLSLDTETARLWLRQAKVTGYAPGRGVAGIFSLFDETLLDDLPEGATLVSPYVLPGGDEGAAIRALGAPSAATLHGWATAKMLAVALWQTGADTPDEAVAALGRLEGYDSGLAPPYQTRPDTRSRTPEGVVIKQQAGAFSAQGGFRRDSF
jgi:ABC-type branched-subunit amino acid transport system substrate-binding protein